MKGQGSRVNQGSSKEGQKSCQKKFENLDIINGLPLAPLQNEF